MVKTKYDKDVIKAQQLQNDQEMAEMLRPYTTTPGKTIPAKVATALWRNHRLSPQRLNEARDHFTGHAQRQLTPKNELTTPLAQRTKGGQSKTKVSPLPPPTDGYVPNTPMESGKKPVRRSVFATVKEGFTNMVSPNRRVVPMQTHDGMGGAGVVNRANTTGKGKRKKKSEETQERRGASTDTKAKSAVAAAFEGSYRDWVATPSKESVAKALELNSDGLVPEQQTFIQTARKNIGTEFKNTPGKSPQTKHIIPPPTPRSPPAPLAAATPASTSQPPETPPTIVSARPAPEHKHQTGDEHKDNPQLVKIGKKTYKVSDEEYKKYETEEHQYKEFINRIKANPKALQAEIQQGRIEIYTEGNDDGGGVDDDDGDDTDEFDVHDGGEGDETDDEEERDGGEGALEPKGKAGDSGLFPAAPTAMPGTGVASQPFSSMTTVSRAGAIDEETGLPDQQASDEFTSNRTDTANSTETFREEYGREGRGVDVIPSPADQLQSDVLFDMFSEVAPGFGNGASNKLFLQQVNRDAKIVYMDQMYEPGESIGPLYSLTPPPWQIQPVMDRGLINEYLDKKKSTLASTAQLVGQNGVASSNV